MRSYITWPPKNDLVENRKYINRKYVNNVYESTISERILPFCFCLQKVTPFWSRYLTLNFAKLPVILRLTSATFGEFFIGTMLDKIYLVDHICLLRLFMYRLCFDWPSRFRFGKYRPFRTYLLFLDRVILRSVL